MGPEVVTISAGGGLFTAWKRVEVQASFQDGARSFTIDAAAPLGGTALSWTFKAGTEVEIFFNGDLVCRGYVDRYQPSISGHDKADVSISGRSKSQDMIDSSAKHASGHFKDKTPAEIGQALDLFGVGITSDVQLEKVPVCRITPGEKAYLVVERLCRDQGVFPVGQADGSIKITKGGQQRHGGSIREGGNMLAGSADHNYAGRHSEITVRGQRPFGSGDENLRIEAVARDGKVRFRPLVIALDGDTDKKRAKKRAASHRDREAGNSLKANVTMQGFRCDGGKVWEPGNLIFVESDFLAVHRDMAVEGVTFTQVRDQGSISELSLVDPRALGGKGNKGGEANDAWGSDAGDDD
jgi:prophage tail gpP-like protein